MNNQYTELMLILLRLEGKIDTLVSTPDDDKANPLTRVLEPSYTLKAGCFACGKVDCRGNNTNLPCSTMTPYALTEGSLMDAGLSQEWVRPIPATVEYIGGR